MSRFGLALALLALACEDPHGPGFSQAGVTSAPVARWSGEGNANDSLGGYHGQIVNPGGVSSSRARPGRRSTCRAAMCACPAIRSLG